MATHPYISGTGSLTQMIQHLKKSFPPTVNSETVKKLGLASNNESYLINAIQFIGIIDSEGKKTTRGLEVFSHHKDEEFQPAFKKLLDEAYSDLNELHGENKWSLSRDELVTYFRKADKTSDAIGQRQAGVFRAFASLAGYGEPEGKANAAKTKKPKEQKTAKSPKLTKKVEEASNSNTQTKQNKNNGSKSDVGLTVRIEINLPAGGTQETYDNIFKSIRANLLNGK